MKEQPQLGPCPFCFNGQTNGPLPLNVSLKCSGGVGVEMGNPTTKRLVVASKHYPGQSDANTIIIRMLLTDDRVDENISFLMANGANGLYNTEGKWQAVVFEPGQWTINPDVEG